MREHLVRLLQDQRELVLHQVKLLSSLPVPSPQPLKQLPIDDDEDHHHGASSAGLSAFGNKAYLDNEGFYFFSVSWSGNSCWSWSVRGGAIDDGTFCTGIHSGPRSTGGRSSMQKQRWGTGSFAGTDRQMSTRRTRPGRIHIDHGGGTCRDICVDACGNSTKTTKSWTSWTCLTTTRNTSSHWRMMSGGDEAFLNDFGLLKPQYIFPVYIMQRFKKRLGLRGPVTTKHGHFGQVLKQGFTFPA